MVTILTDSCSDLSPELSRKYNIKTIPLYVFVNERTYQDGVDIQIEELFRIVDESKKLPKTSAPTIPDFEKFFSENPGDVIFIGIGSKLSATYQNAYLAARSFPERKIYTIDSRNLSTGIGLSVLYAAELRDMGLSADEIVGKTNALISKVHTSFVIDTLEYLYMGGRCSAMENIIGSLLKIRPIIEVKPDGTLGVKEKNRGSRQKSLDVLLEDFRKNLPCINLHRVFVTHAACRADADYLATELMNLAPIDELNITSAGATVASHCGPNTIGILYTIQ